MTQTGVVAVAAMVLRFGEDSAERDWGWSVMERVNGITEPEGRDAFGNNPYDPRAFYIAILKRDGLRASPSLRSVHGAGGRRVRELSDGV